MTIVVNCSQFECEIAALRSDIVSKENLPTFLYFFAKFNHSSYIAAPQLKLTSLR